MDAIDEADLFQLFWSKAAARSPFVEQEWRHALELYRAGRGDFIRPVYWARRPHPVPRDLDIEKIHFQRLNLKELGWIPRRLFWY